MKRTLVFICLACFISLITSCQNSGINKSSVALAPAENIQMLFERYEELGDEQAKKWKKHFVEIKGNTLILKNKKSAINYVLAHEPEILLEPNLKFIFDTVLDHQKLFAIDQDKSVLLLPKSILTNDTTQSTTLFLTPQKKLELSRFYVNQIGRELLMIDKNGFVAGAATINKTDEDNLTISCASEPAK